MMIVYPDINFSCEVNEENILTIIIEDQQLFTEIVTDIYSQITGDDGKTVISEDLKPMDMRKHIDLITQLVPFTLNQKELLSRLFSELKESAVDEKMYQRTHKLLALFSEYLYELTEDLDNGIAFDTPEDITGLLKSFNVRFDDDDMSLTEKLLEYMIASYNYKGRRIFVTVNLRNYITDSQAEAFFRSVLLKKLFLICLEGSEHKRLSMERTVIIDWDSCLI